jgi:hypothetical protein
MIKEYLKQLEEDLSIVQDPTEEGHRRNNE